MATFKEGINGGFSGKAGTVIGYYRMGKWVMRAVPKTSGKNKQGTEAQKACRTRFTLIQRFLKPMPGFVNAGFTAEGQARQITAHNAAKSHNMRVFTPEGTIDYSKILISYGRLPGTVSAKVERDDAGLHVSWDPKPLRKEGDVDPGLYDQVILMAYYLEEEDTYQGNRVFGRPSGARRKAGSDVIELPDHRKGKPFHVWMAFISDDRRDVSTSQYLGEHIF